MTCGLYGKLPMKRDFISVSVPQPFLALWEPWLQDGLQASRDALGDRWRPAFQQAPIWRFWLGAGLCGVSVLGSFMPSIDGVGRYFPLTAFACADPGAFFSPPQHDAQPDWFSRVEEMLLGVLDDAASYDATLEILNRLPAPTSGATAAGGVAIVSSAAIIMCDEDGLERGLATLAEDRAGSRLRSSCFLWTIGGDNLKPIALLSEGLPDASIFDGLLTGDFIAPDKRESGL